MAYKEPVSAEQIVDDAVSNDKLANVPTATFKGRTTAATGDPEDLTATQATAMLNNFTSTLKGLAPLSGGGTANFLRADGTWAAPTAALIWQPPTLPLGAVLASGATFFINGGAGIYLSFSGTSDDQMFFNYVLHGANGVEYDGSDLAVVLHGRLSSNGGVGDTVGLIAEYAILKDGDNSTTTSTTIAQQNVNVASELQDIMFMIQLGTMTGVADAHQLMFTLTRNSSGAGADSYAGNFEVTALELVIIP